MLPHVPSMTDFPNKHGFPSMPDIPSMYLMPHFRSMPPMPYPTHLLPADTAAWSTYNAYYAYYAYHAYYASKSYQRCGIARAWHVLNCTSMLA